MKKLIEAFNDFDVSKEKHKGNIDYFISERSLICSSYHKGDIVYVKKDKKTSTLNHLFVLIDEDMHGRLITTSKIGEFIKKDDINNLIDDSYLTSSIYQIDPSKILFKIGILEEI